MDTPFLNKKHIIFRLICISLVITLLWNEVSFASDEMRASLSSGRSCLAVPSGFDPIRGLSLRDGKYVPDISKSGVDLLKVSPPYFLLYLLAYILAEKDPSEIYLENCIEETIVNPYGEDKLAKFNWREIRYENGEFILPLTSGKKWIISLKKPKGKIIRQFEYKWGKPAWVREKGEAQDDVPKDPEPLVASQLGYRASEGGGTKDDVEAVLYSAQEADLIRSQTESHGPQHGVRRLVKALIGGFCGFAVWPLTVAATLPVLFGIYSLGLINGDAAHLFAPSSGNFSSIVAALVANVIIITHHTGPEIFSFVAMISLFKYYFFGTSSASLTALFYKGLSFYLIIAHSILFLHFRNSFAAPFLVFTSLIIAYFINLAIVKVGFNLLDRWTQSPIPSAESTDESPRSQQDKKAAKVKSEPSSILKSEPSQPESILSRIIAAIRRFLHKDTSGEWHIGWLADVLKWLQTRISTRRHTAQFKRQCFEEMCFLEAETVHIFGKLVRLAEMWANILGRDDKNRELVLELQAKIDSIKGLYLPRYLYDLETIMLAKEKCVDVVVPWIDEILLILDAHDFTQKDEAKGTFYRKRNIITNTLLPAYDHWLSITKPTSDAGLEGVPQDGVTREDGRGKKDEIARATAEKIWNQEEEPVWGKNMGLMELKALLDVFQREGGRIEKADKPRWDEAIIRFRRIFNSSVLNAAIQSGLFPNLNLNEMKRVLIVEKFDPGAVSAYLDPLVASDDHDVQNQLKNYMIFIGNVVIEAEFFGYLNQPKYSIDMSNAFWIPNISIFDSSLFRVARQGKDVSVPERIYIELGVTRTVFQLIAGNLRSKDEFGLRIIETRTIPKNMLNARNAEYFDWEKILGRVLDFMGLHDKDWAGKRGDSVGAAKARDENRTVPEIKGHPVNRESVTEESGDKVIRDKRTSTDIRIPGSPSPGSPVNRISKPVVPMEKMEGGSSILSSRSGPDEVSGESGNQVIRDKRTPTDIRIPGSPSPGSPVNRISKHAEPVESAPANQIVLPTETSQSETEIDDKKDTSDKIAKRRAEALAEIEREGGEVATYKEAAKGRSLVLFADDVFKDAYTFDVRKGFEILKYMLKGGRVVFIVEDEALYQWILNDLKPFIKEVSGIETTIIRSSGYNLEQWKKDPVNKMESFLGKLRANNIEKDDIFAVVKGFRKEDECINLFTKNPEMEKFEVPLVLLNYNGTDNDKKPCFSLLDIIVAAAKAHISKSWVKIIPKITSITEDIYRMLLEREEIDTRA